MSWFKLNLKGYKILKQIQPGFLMTQTASSTITAIIPFVNLFMSALILNRLAMGDFYIPALILYIGIIITFNLVFALLSGILQKRLTVMSQTRRMLFFTFLSKNHAELSYEQATDTKTDSSLMDIMAKTSSTSAGLRN